MKLKLERDWTENTVVASIVTLLENKPDFMQEKDTFILGAVISKHFNNFVPDRLITRAQNQILGLTKTNTVTKSE
jgi:hypothetical protein